MDINDVIRKILPEGLKIKTVCKLLEHLGAKFYNVSSTKGICGIEVE